MKQFHLVSPASIRDWLHWQSPMKPHRGPPKLVHTQPYTANIHSAHRLAWCDSLRCRQSKLAVTVLSRYPFRQTGQGWQISQCPWLIRLPSRSCSNERTGHFNPHMHSNTQTLKHSNTEYWTDSGLCDDNAFVMRTQTLNRILVGPCGALWGLVFKSVLIILGLSFAKVWLAATPTDIDSMTQWIWDWNRPCNKPTT